MVKIKSVNVLMQLDTCRTPEHQNSPGLPMVIRRAFDPTEEMGFGKKKMCKCLKRDSFTNFCHENEEHSRCDNVIALYGTNFLLAPIFKAPLTSVEFHLLIQKVSDWSFKYVKPFFSFRVLPSPR